MSRKLTLTEVQKKIRRRDLVKAKLQLSRDLTPRPKLFIATPTGQKLFRAGKLWVPYLSVGPKGTAAARDRGCPLAQRDLVRDGAQPQARH